MYYFILMLSNDYIILHKTLLYFTMLVHVEDALVILCLQSLWPAVPQVSGVVSRVTVSDSICRIQLPASVSALFFQRRHGSYCAKLTRIRSGWASQVLTKRICWCAEIIRPSFWQDATSPLPVSHFQTWFHSSTDVPDNTEQNQPRSSLVLADCVRFWPNRSGPEASWWAKIIRHASGQCFPADPDWMRIRSGMFTGGLPYQLPSAAPPPPHTHTHTQYSHTMPAI